MDAHYYADNASPIRATVLEADAKKDLAVLELESLPVNAPSLKLAGEGPGPGETIYSIGHPGADKVFWLFSFGKVRGLKQFQSDDEEELNVRTILSDLRLNPGDSGGPVVDEDGNLVGVNMAINTRGRGISYSIDVAEVKDFLDRVKRLDKLSASKKP